MAWRQRVVVVGAGFGGIAVARALRKESFDVLLIDRNNHHVFQPLLYQVATAALETSEVGFPLRSLLRRQTNTEVLMATVAAIDPSTRSVHLENGHAVVYDYLILAAGAEPFYFGHPEYRAYAPSLKGLEDAIEMRHGVLMAFERAEQEPDPVMVRALLTFVVVGAGPTGVELAGAIAELARRSLRRDFRHIDPTQARVLLVQAGPEVLPTYPASLRIKAVRQLASLGVEVRTSAPVTSVDEVGVLIDGGERIFARTVLWTAGVATVPLARTLGVPVDRHGRIEVDATLRPRGLDDVFVIGDAAALMQDGQPVPGVAPAAIQGGRYAARAIVSRLQGRAVKLFRYRNKGELATIGRSRAVAILPPRIELSGFWAWLLYMTIHLFYLSGFRTRTLVFLSWVWSYLTWSRGARLIPSVKRPFGAAEEEPVVPEAEEEPHAPLH